MIGFTIRDSSDGFSDRREEVVVVWPGVAIGFGTLVKSAIGAGPRARLRSDSDGASRGTVALDWDGTAIEGALLASGRRSFVVVGYARTSSLE